MSRFHRFAHSLASSYAAQAAGMVYVLVSVPLALHYLPKREFGLWAVMAQVVGYIALIELGMTSSVARHLIDHKDRPSGGIYGSVIQTGSLVLVVQGGIIFLVGFALSPLVARLLAIPADLQDDFIVLLRWQSGIMAFDFATRIFTQIIYAHQRVDLSNYGDIVGFGLNLLVLWIAFHEGCGLYSILWSVGVVAVFAALLRFIICWKCRMLPSSGSWSGPTLGMFRELFHYGRDVFLTAVGLQLANASQAIIVTRTLGLDVAAVWYVCTKAFVSVGDLIARFFNLSEPMFAEMMVRNEVSQLRRRFGELVVVTGSLSGLAAVLSAVTNGAFVAVWTAGRVSWSPWNDVLLGLWVMVRTVVRCHSGFKVMTKKIEMLHCVIFAEGLSFVVLALLVARVGGIPAIIGASILCSALLTGNYTVRQSARYLGLPLAKVVWEWLIHPLRLLAFLTPLAIATWWISQFFPVKIRLIWDLGVLGIGGGLLWLRWGIPFELQLEILRRVPKPYQFVFVKLLSVRP